MDLDTFEKQFKDIIMSASQAVLSKTGDRIVGQSMIDNYKQTSTFTGKTIREVAFMEMLNSVNKLKEMCLTTNLSSGEAWKEVLSDLIERSAVLYALYSQGAKIGTKDEENKK